MKQFAGLGRPMLESEDVANAVLYLLSTPLRVQVCYNL